MRTDGRTNSHDEADCRFSQFWEGAQGKKAETVFCTSKTNLQFVPRREQHASSGMTNPVDLFGGIIVVHRKIRIKCTMHCGAVMLAECSTPQQIEVDM